MLNLFERFLMFDRLGICFASNNSIQTMSDQYKILKELKTFKKTVDLRIRVSPGLLTITVS